MSTKTLIIPDIHLQYDRVDKIIQKENLSDIIFLGDYFDDFNDSVEQNVKMAEWLKESLSNKNRIHLLGNHDMHYAFKASSFRCSGYREDKDRTINNVLNKEDWGKLRLHTWVGSWLCSHAGVHDCFYSGEPSGFKSWIKNTTDEALKRAVRDVSPVDPILEAGRSRGGRALTGGITWCDAREFRCIRGVNQIFGHTTQNKPLWLNTRELSKNLCLDTKLKYYGIHDSELDSIEMFQS